MSSPLGKSADQLTSAHHSSSEVRPPEVRQRRRVTLVAAVVALVVFIAGLSFIAIKGFTVHSTPAVTTSTSTETSTTGGQATTKTVYSKVTTVAGTDDSFVGLAFGEGATPFLVEVAIGALLAFGSGALVQRIWLGEYGITLGPVAIPALAPITEAAAGKIVDQINESPTIREILGPGPKGPAPHPIYREVSDPRTALIVLRGEVEARLRDLAITMGLDRDIETSRLPARLARAGVFSEDIADGLKSLLNIGDRVAQGAEITDAAAGTLRDSGTSVLYALAELTRRERDRRSHEQ